jgi:DNA-binding MarR family transcriptional regulator
MSTIEKYMVRDNPSPEVAMSSEFLGHLELLDDVGFLLSYSSGRAVRASNARLAPLGLRVRQYSVLSVVCDSHGISQRELSDVLGLDPSQIVALVDDLQALGLVERLPDPADRRTRLVAATRKGETTRKRGRAAVESAREDFLSPLDVQDRGVLAEILQRMVIEDQAESVVGTGRRGAN